MTDAEAIEQFVQRHGVTRCPPAYVAPVNGGDPVGTIHSEVKTKFQKKRAKVTMTLAGKVASSAYWRGRKRS